MASDPTEYVVSKLRAGGYDPQETGPNQWRARCPGHNGKSPPGPPVEAARSESTAAGPVVEKRGRGRDE